MRTNKNILKITLFIVLGSMAVGCQKEDLQNNTLGRKEDI